MRLTTGYAVLATASVGRLMNRSGGTLVMMSSVLCMELIHDVSASMSGAIVVAENFSFSGALGWMPSRQSTPMALSCTKRSMA